MVSHLPLDLPAPDRQPSTSALISINHCANIHLSVPTIMGSICTFKLTRLRCPRASLDLLDYGLQGCMSMAATCLSHPARTRHPIVATNSLNNGIEVHPCGHIVRPPCVSVCSLDHSLQVHLPTCSIMTSLCIFKFT